MGGEMRPASERRSKGRAANERTRWRAVIVGVGCGVSAVVFLAAACTNTDPIPLPQVDAAAPEATVQADGGR